MQCMCFIIIVFVIIVIIVIIHCLNVVRCIIVYLKYIIIIMKFQKKLFSFTEHWHFSNEGFKLLHGLNFCS